MLSSGFRRFRSSWAIPFWIWPFGASIEPEYFLFLDVSAPASVADCNKPCITGFTCMVDPLANPSSSSSVSADMEMSDAESSLSITVVVSITAGIRLLPARGAVCAGEESAEEESAEDESVLSEDISLPGDSIVIRLEIWTGLWLVAEG